MQRALLGLALLPLLAQGAAAAPRLEDPQLDVVTAGVVLTFTCPGCTLSTSSSASNNGVTVSASSTVILPPTGPSGGTGGTGGTGGGTTDPGPTGPSVGTSVPIPPQVATIISNASGPTVVAF